MTDGNALYGLFGALLGIAAGMVAMIALFALGSAGRGRSARRATYREALAAWRGMGPLLPGWRPTGEQLEGLEADPPEVQRAYRSIAYGWDPRDARWDVLVAVLVWTRREALRFRVEQIRAIAEQAPPVKMVPPSAN